MTCYQREFLCDVIDEVQPLLDAHYQELTHHKDKIKLDPQWDQYTALELLNKFFIYTARDESELVGYAAFFLMTHMHYRATVVAQNDVLFLRADKRQGTTGIRLIDFAEAELKKLGADKIVWHIKFSKDLRPILHRRGYRDEEVMTAKMLKD